MYRLITHLGRTCIWLIGMMSLVVLSSCREDFSATYPTQALRFSATEIFLDTVFTEKVSSTYWLKVYNDESQVVEIPQIRLEKGAQSYFFIEVEGRQSQDQLFENTVIRAQDSLLIFISIEPATINGSETIYNDNLIFDLGGSAQQVELSALVEEAELFKPAEGQSSYVISANTIWDATKVKIIYGELKVMPNYTLTIEEGTQIYFHTNASLLIDQNAGLEVEGTLEQPVSFRGYRQEPRYDTLPGTWDRIKIAQEGKASLNYVHINGATFGLQVERAEATLSNAQIYNSSSAGLYLTQAKVTASNVAINNASGASVFIEEGGVYNFKQCSLVNYWSYPSNYKYAVYMSNYRIDEGVETQGDLQASFVNNIIYSDKGEGLYLYQVEGTIDSYTFRNNLIDGRTDFVSDPAFVNNIFNEDPLLMSVGTLSKNDLQLTSGSPAIDQADSEAAVEIPQDITGKRRVQSPDIGAYEY